jgi:hypothetical protein
MTKNGFALAALAITLMASLAPNASRANDSGSSGGWKAGVARAVITPDKPMWMTGYASRNKPAEGKLTDLHAKALVLEDASGKRVLLVTLDLCGIDRETSNHIRDRLASEQRLPREAVVLSCSHTHSGPTFGHYLPALLTLSEADQHAVEAYTRHVEDTIVQAAASAIASLAPAKLTWTLGHADFAVNRRENPEKKVPELRAAGELKGPVDHELPVLTVTSGDSIKAIVFGYACHATTTSKFEWSADWPGVACANIEKSHPGAVAMSWIGCAGDQNPLPRGSYDLLHQHGKEASDAVEAALSDKSAAKPVEPATLAMTYGEIDLPFAALPTKENLEADTKSDNKWRANRARLLLAKLQRDGQLSPHYPYPIETWKLGNGVTWVFLGGEATVEYSIRLKKELGGSVPGSTWVASYCNDVMAYIPSLKVLNEGRYEGEESMIYYGQPTKWSPEIEELIVDEAHRQADGLK